MTASSYDEALRRVLVHEGGYSNHPSDPGGPTNWGITIHDARAYWKTEATADDVRSMPVEVAKDIYRSKYWDAMRCDDLPVGVDYAVFDYGVNSGIGRAVRVLQRLAGTNVDGEVGPDTIAATARTAAVKLINQICDERLAFLQGLETWGVFGKGWGRRVREVRVAALAMVDEISRDIGASPPWLATMREISGTREYAGGADNPLILEWARFIGEKYPEMRSYCAQYNHDAIAWCGLTVAYCMAKNGIRPVFGKSENKRFLWADAWRAFGVRLDRPKLGCVMVFARNGGGHVALYEGEEGNDYLIRGGNPTRSTSCECRRANSPQPYGRRLQRSRHQLPRPPRPNLRKSPTRKRSVSAPPSWRPSRRRLTGSTRTPPSLSRPQSSRCRSSYAPYGQYGDSNEPSRISHAACHHCGRLLAGRPSPSA